MRAATFFCALATAQAWKMPAGSLLEKPGRPHCEVPAGYKRQPTAGNDTKWKGSQRVPTEVELHRKGFLADPYLHTIYYINLEKSKDRADHMMQQLERTASAYHAERYAARNKSEAKGLKKEMYTTNKERVQGGSGTVATYLSHRTMLDKIAQHKDENAVFVVLEDDAVLTDGWVEEVMCQIKLLPADWDLYKFGYWPLPGAQWAYDHTCSGNKRQKLYNEYTCNQRSFALEWMGNLGYAVRPAGARKALEHLGAVPVMDVDGAMMPGCCVSQSATVAQNIYVSRYTLVKHGKFHSVRLMDKAMAGTAPNLTAFSDADEDRESSYQARVRLTEAFKRGEMESYAPHDSDVEESEDDKDKVTALAGLGA
jgi:GR25 family glycosyltransferase involved in LPS biosynthesis